MNRPLLAAVGGMIVIAGAGLVAQSGTIRLAPPGLVAPRFSAPWNPDGTQTRVVGSVIDIRQVPVAGAKVQLRNLANGTVQQVTESDANGEYQFDVDNPSNYVVEMVLVDGHILALSNAGTLGRYETMRTVIMLPGRWDARLREMVAVQNMGSFVGMSSQTTMTATTLLLAVDMNISPTNAGEPVSPFSQ